MKCKHYLEYIPGNWSGEDGFLVLLFYCKHCGMVVSRNMQNLPNLKYNKMKKDNLIQMVGRVYKHSG